MHHTITTARQRGFSLIEAAIVLGVVGLVIGSIWIAASAMMEKRRESRMLEQILQVTGKLRSTLPDFAFFPDGATLLFGTNRDIWTPYFPPDMIDGSTYPRTPWGGRVMLSLQGGLMAWDIDVDLATCIKMGPRIYATTKAQIYESGAPVWTQGEGYDISTPELAAQNCPQELSSRGEIIIVFGIKY